MLNTHKFIAPSMNGQSNLCSWLPWWKAGWTKFCRRDLRVKRACAVNEDINPGENNKIIWMGHYQCYHPLSSVYITHHPPSQYHINTKTRLISCGPHAVLLWNDSLKVWSFLVKSNLHIESQSGPSWPWSR